MFSLSSQKGLPSVPLLLWHRQREIYSIWSPHSLIVHIVVRYNPLLWTAKGAASWTLTLRKGVGAWRVVPVACCYISHSFGVVFWHTGVWRVSKSFDEGQLLLHSRWSGLALCECLWQSVLWTDELETLLIHWVEGCGCSSHDKLSHHNPGKDVAVAQGEGKCWSGREG